MLMGVVPGAQFYSFQLLYIFEFWHIVVHIYDLFNA